MRCERPTRSRPARPSNRTTHAASVAPTLSSNSMPSSILVTGGAGYIGSHTCVELMAAGFEPVIVDNLVDSKREAVARSPASRVASRCSSKPTAATRRARSHLRRAFDRRRDPLRRPEGGRRRSRSRCSTTTTTCTARGARRCDDARRRQAARVFLVGDRLRRAPDGADPRGLAAARRPPVRPHQPMEEQPAGWTSRRPPGVARRAAALLQPRSACTPAGSSAKTRSASPTT